MKFEKKILITVSSLTVIIFIILMIVSLGRIKKSFDTAITNKVNSQQLIPVQEESTGPVSQNFKLVPVNEERVQQMASEFNALNSKSKSSDIITQQQTNQDLLLQGLNGDATRPQGINGILDTIGNKIGSLFSKLINSNLS